MKARWMPAIALAVAMCGCAKTQGHDASTATRQGTASARAETVEAPEPGETKLPLDQTPPAVRKTLEHELVGADLEDIARKQKGGKTIYEVKDAKWTFVDQTKFEGTTTTSTAAATATP